MSVSPRKRCAIYTRKSTEGGLDQAFNTLVAQREACEAYILSQAGEGWECLPDRYDDGGWSGGNMDRPALKALLADIVRGRIDIVVVYKVDRLTRSLMDFARIVETFDANSASFVSVTQAFNTTNSMGRLTLNVLLSFAQFEREVTGERIRDKIAASRAKGMFMGGNVPLGYDLGDRKLEVNETEAETVRHIFTRYLDLKSVPALAKELAAQGIRSKRWTSRTGKTHGGLPFHVGALAHILRNGVYRGFAVHKGKAHAGEHDAIVPAELFNAVQEQLEANQVKRSARKTRAASSPLTGKIHDADDQPMSVSFSYGRGKKMYRYYLSDCLLPRTANMPTNREGQRFSAARVERAISVGLRDLVVDQHDADLFGAITKVTALGDRLFAEIDVAAIADDSALGATRIISRAELIDADAKIDGDILRISVPLPPDRSGRTKQSPGQTMVGAETKADLATLVHTAHRRLDEINASPIMPSAHSQMTAGATEWIRQRIVIGLLAPDIQRALLTGSAPDHVTPEWMLKQEWPLDWAEQRKLVGLPT
ncbi:recombinase family protein [Sphingopyxis alaskensis]|uniref:recombinase family protein n=1 Tax=Sphingopyxis alaskensis TaxID=117207 RepID=UPI003918D7FE